MARVFTIRRKVFVLFGAQFQIFDEENNLIGMSKQKAFKLKEDIRVFADEKMTDERMMIKARSILDFSSAYDVIKTATQELMGTYKRKGWSSMLRDSWLLMDPSGNEVGKIEEDSMMLAMLRRLIFKFIPQTFKLKVNGEEWVSFKTSWNPFVHRMTVTIHDDCDLDPLLVLAGGVLLVAVEGRQQ